MSVSFDPKKGPIQFRGVISGPKGRAELRLVLNTGATNSLIHVEVLGSIGYDPAASTDRVQAAMGNGAETVPRIIVNHFTAFGVHRIGIPLLAKALPPEAGVDCLPGLDFLRGHILTLNFRGGVRTLA